MNFKSITPQLFQEFETIKQKSTRANLVPVVEGPWEERLKHWEAWERWWKFLESDPGSRTLNEKVNALLEASDEVRNLPSPTVRGHYRSDFLVQICPVEFEWHNPVALALCASVFEKTMAAGWHTALPRLLEEASDGKPALSIRPKGFDEERWSAPAVCIASTLVVTDHAHRHISDSSASSSFQARLDRGDWKEWLQDHLKGLNGTVSPFDFGHPFWHQAREQTLDALLLDPRTNDMGWFGFLALSWGYGQHVKASSGVLDFLETRRQPPRQFTTLVDQMKAHWLSNRLSESFQAIPLPPRSVGPRF